MNRKSIETESSKVTKGKGSHWGRDRHRMLTNHNEREKSTLACPYSFYSSIPTMRGKKTITERLSGEGRRSGKVSSSLKKYMECIIFKKFIKNIFIRKFFLFKNITTLKKKKMLDY